MSDEDIVIAERAFVRDVRLELAKALDAGVDPINVLIELLLDAASVHRSVRLQGRPLSIDDFRSWCETAYEKSKPMSRTLPTDVVS